MKRDRTGRDGTDLYTVIPEEEPVCNEGVGDDIYEVPHVCQMVQDTRSVDHLQGERERGEKVRMEVGREGVG